MRQTGSRRWSVGVGVGAVLVLIVLLAPPLLLGESFSPFRVLLLAGGLLGSGLLMRLRADGVPRTMGTILVVVGMVALAVGLLALAVGVWGRY